MSPQTLQYRLFADRVDCIKSAQVVSIGLKSNFDSKRGGEGKRMSEKMIVACPDCETRFVAPLEKFLPAGRKVRCAKCGHSWFQQLENTETAAEAAPVDDIAEDRVEAPAQSIMDRAAQATVDQPDARIQKSAMAPEPTDTASPDRSVDTPDDTSTETTETTEADTTETNAAAVAASIGAGAIGTQALGKVVDHDRIDSSNEMDEPRSISMNEPRTQKRSFWPRAIFYSVAAAIIVGALGYFFKNEISSQVPALDPPLTTWKKTVDGVVSKAVPSNRALRIENVKYDLDEAGDERAMLLTADVANESGSKQNAPKLNAAIYAADDSLLRTVNISPETSASEIEAQTSLTYFLRLPNPPEDMDRVEVDFSE